MSSAVLGKQATIDNVRIHVFSPNIDLSNNNFVVQPIHHFNFKQLHIATNTHIFRPCSTVNLKVVYPFFQISYVYSLGPDGTSTCSLSGWSTCSVLLVSGALVVGGGGTGVVVLVPVNIPRTHTQD